MQPEIPNPIEDLYAQARTLLDAGEAEAAAAIYRSVLEADPAQARAHNNLGTILEGQDRPDEAMACYAAAIAIEPRLALTHYNIGRLAQARGRIEQALLPYRMAIALRRDYPAAYFNLTHALIDLGREVDARDVVEDWLAACPADERALHLRAALTGDDVPARASDAFVRRVFDRMAADFDTALAALDYRAPQLVAAALLARQGTTTAAEVLDAGCGTGLLGPLLRDRSIRLVGVDLSPAMLAQAERRGCYDALAEAELEAYLSAAPGAWDVIVSADTLVYFGALDTVLAAAATALRPGGWLIFTLETMADDGHQPGYRLGLTGRYAHTETYVADALDAAGLESAGIESAILRQEAGVPVQGLVVAGRRPAQA